FLPFREQADSRRETPKRRRSPHSTRKSGSVTKLTLRLRDWFADGLLSPRPAVLHLGHLLARPADVQRPLELAEVDLTLRAQLDAHAGRDGPLADALGDAPSLLRSVTTDQHIGFVRPSADL